MPPGWIKLHRKIVDCEALQEKRKFSKFEAWVDLLLQANYKDKKAMINSNLVEVKRGSFITSERQLARRWGWARNTVRKFLGVLQREQMLNENCTAKYTTLTIANYDFYQGEYTTDVATEWPENEPVGSQCVNTTKEVKKDKKVKKGTTPYIPLKNQYAEYVAFTEAEHQKLVDKFGLELPEAIEILNNYKGSTGKKYKSDYHTMLGWVAKEIGKGSAASQRGQPAKKPKNPDKYKDLYYS